MRDGNGSDRFGTFAKVFHWVTFMLLLASFGIGLTMVGLPLGLRKLQAYSWHKWVGVTVLLITILRLGWRCFDPPPPFPASMPGWQKIAARLSHAGLYATAVGHADFRMGDEFGAWASRRYISDWFRCPTWWRRTGRWASRWFIFITSWAWHSRC